MGRVSTAERRSVPWVILLLLAGCGAFAPTPTPSPPMMSFQVLVDIGLFGGPPEVPPDYTIVEFTDDTSLLMVDRGAVQHLREVRWNGQRWEVVGGTDARLIPADESGPYLRAVAMGPDDGLSTEAVLLVGRVPNGPINRFELEIDGAIGDIWVNQRPAFLAVLPAGTKLGTRFTAFDAGTHELETGSIHHE
jgi:hypothetical protein